MTTAAQPFGKLAHTKGLQKKSMFRNVDLGSFSRSFPLFRYLDVAGYLLSMIIVLWIYSVHVRSIVQYPYFAPSANVEELAYTHISSSNFNKFGFLATDFLQDFAASPNRSDHPYVYDHMPPGPDVARALVMRVTGRSFSWTAIIFASLVPIGFVFYFLFLNTVFRNRVVLGGIFLLLLTSLGTIRCTFFKSHLERFSTVNFCATGHSALQLPIQGAVVIFLNCPTANPPVFGLSRLHSLEQHPCLLVWPLFFTNRSLDRRENLYSQSVPLHSVYF